MDMSPRKSLKRPAEPVDDWLRNEGYYRKLAPRDPTCLFRAFGEQIYATQHYHIRCRRECVDFMRKNFHLFEKSISISSESYLEQMSCFTEWGGPNEINAMSLLYKREILIFDGQKFVTRAATENGFKDTIYLCHTPQKQYETVYPVDFIANAAYCQSLVYQTLYKEVFKMPNVDETVQKMLHDRTTNLRHDKFFLKGNLEIREKLTTELLNKIDKRDENGEEEKSIPRCVTPFPYRVAKALDPNIYRNTDFDIWHEIRREVRNAGWTRWNGTELQIGGKCLVQLDYNETKLDETNNNFGQLSVDNDNNNDGGSRESSLTKNSPVKREPTFLYGHIQEMSKNEGPVVVFIEELGEKRTLPYAALKPIATRRNRLNNWSLNNCRRYSTYHTNQKWKRTWNSNSRKSKEITTSYVTKNPVDGNNNRNDNRAEDKVKDNEKLESWNDLISDEKKNTGSTNYTMETYNSCQGFPVENTIDVRPVTVLLDNPVSNICPPVLQRNNDDCTKSSSQILRNSTNESAERRSPNVDSTVPESIIQPLQQISLNSPGETFYPSHQGMSGMSPVFPSNGGVVFASQDGNPYPVPFPCFAGEPPAPGSLLDRTLRAINLLAPASVEANGSDLPLSDTVTLRFFYNLGLEYFRASQPWGYGANGQSISLPGNFVPQMNYSCPSGPIDASQQVSTGTNEDDNARSINPPRPNVNNYSNGRRRNVESPSSMAKNNNNNNNNNNVQQQQMTKTFNNRKNETQQDLSNAQRNNDPSTRTIADSHGRGYQTYASNDRNKDQSNGRKNFPTSRYKKNVDNRNRNVLPASVYQPDNHKNSLNYENSGCHEPTASFQGGGKASEAIGHRQNSQNFQYSCHQTAPPSPINSQQGNYQTSYGPQAIYTTVPYYTNDAGDTFYAHGAGFYPLPYVATGHGDVVDAGSTVNPYGQPVYPPLAENYGQPMTTVYPPPYVYPPQAAIYSPTGGQNVHDNWYPVNGQGQYMQYPQISQTPTNPNGATPSP